MSKHFENILGITFVVMFLTLIGLVYYACEAYPSVIRVEGDKTHGSISLSLGSLCDPPAKLVSDFEKANPQIEVESTSISREWGKPVLEIKFKKK